MPPNELVEILFEYLDNNSLSSTRPNYVRKNVFDFRSRSANENTNEVMSPVEDEVEEDDEDNVAECDASFDALKTPLMPPLPPPITLTALALKPRVLQEEPPGMYPPIIY